MRSTLAEVLGRARGRRMYSLAWLERRVRFHLDSERRAQVFVAQARGGAVVGHTIVRAEGAASGRAFGLFSTTYVAPAYRRRGVAERLLRRGERWMRRHRLPRAATYTSEANAKLIRLYEKLGYAVVARYPRKKMIELSKRLTGVRRGRASDARASSA
ncbi:MAG: GNAT family N-acetyltransferase [Elusimicrobia bacterium]|nr:GNAT family N-acetyltransferase [Elusimicrobiota bacterium]